MNKNRVLILDFGSQTTQLIARRVRENGYFCEIHPFNTDLEKLKAFGPQAIILSGGPANISGPNAPKLQPEVLGMGAPILGICYGMQVLMDAQGGEVLGADKKEFGFAELSVIKESELFSGLGKKLDVWMSHGDQVQALAQGFETVALTRTCPHAAVQNIEKNIYGVQFHPEVVHTKVGSIILSNFLGKICGLSPTWKMQDFLEEKIESIKSEVGSERVLMGLSGGVDSCVAAALIAQAIGKQLICIHVDHGLSREGEVAEIKELFLENFDLDLHIVDAKEQFFAGLHDVTDPELKRKIIGRIFIDVFRNEAEKLGEMKYLGQGTLYPDVVESVSVHGGPSAVIKSHHNVGGLPEDMEFELLEPLRMLFKDEVRKLGQKLGLPDSILKRQPFPGPGLAVRILGPVDQEQCERLRKADAIVREEIDQYIEQENPKEAFWQWFAILLPVKSVGVMGDERAYGDTIAVRCVESNDAMTADWIELPKRVLSQISGRIINEVESVTRVVYDISSKPPATIEWE